MKLRIALLGVTKCGVPASALADLIGPHDRVIAHVSTGVGALVNCGEDSDV